MSRMTLLRLPAELLYHTLAFLNGPTTAATYDLVRLRETCKALKALIDDSETLQYIIDLCYFRVIHVGPHETDVPLAIHRSQLREHEDAWRTFGYQQKCTLQPASTQAIRVIGGIYGSIREGRIHFARLPPVSGPDDVHSWNHLIDVHPLFGKLDFTFCPEQDLLVVVASEPHNSNHLFNIHLRSLTTNEAHPNAAQSVLKAFDSLRGSFMFPEAGKLRINGNYVSLHCEDIIGRCCVQTWDWKCREGYQFILPFNLDEQFTDYTFIAEDQFIVGSLGARAMEIYSITDKSKPPQRMVILSLPSLKKGWLYRELTTSINPGLGSVFLDLQKSAQRPSYSFRPNLDDQLIIFHVRVVNEDEDQMSFIFAARLGTIQGFGEPFYEIFPWLEWGPQNTTWFLGDYGQSLYGFRTAGFVDGGSSYWHFEARRPSRLCIRDFNPHNVCNYGAGGETGRRGRLVRGGASKRMKPFREPLGSALPYREIISEEPFDGQETIMDESRILLLERNPERTNVEVLIF